MLLPEVLHVIQCDTAVAQAVQVVPAEFFIYPALHHEHSICPPLLYDV